MAVIGLLGNEYDHCINLLKVRIEDLGHRARVINLTHLPRVTRVTIDPDNIICDGYNLLEMDGFYLGEMELRDPFFHVSYTRELWALLLDRYMPFAASEVDNAVFARNILEILALNKPMVNTPRVYSFRRMIPYLLDFLGNRGFPVWPFTTGFADEREARGFDEQLPMSLDEARTGDVLSFPKGKEKGLRIWRKKPAGIIYKLIIVGKQPLNDALAVPMNKAEPCRIKLAKLPRGIEDTAIKAAEVVEAEFAEVELLYSENGGKVWLLKVDPCPYFYELEEVHGLKISGSLAEYLVDVAV